MVLFLQLSLSSCVVRKASNYTLYIHYVMLGYVYYYIMQCYVILLYLCTVTATTRTVYGKSVHLTRLLCQSFRPSPHPLSVTMHHQIGVTEFPVQSLDIILHCTLIV